MATTTFSVVRGKVVRVTELDACGSPMVTGGYYAVSEGFIQVAITSELEAGDEFIQKNANGVLCINERAPDELKRLNVTVDWCNVHPDIIELITGNTVETDSGDAVGFRIQAKPADTNFALEVWTGLGGANCAGGNQQYGYLLIPFLTGSTVGDITIANAAATFQTLGYTQGNSGWGVGPYDVIGTPGSETPLATPMGAIDHALLRVVEVPPPVPTPTKVLINP